ncbi:hypothetical protein DS2_16099 [Catenovulum agarivorans DS-2]|uniref:Uncharacterized protein n=1 Tax=Catenovulum agarivorans DS-2 TaxID=1328313 RepID=W7QTE3_9ALTE|nr:hypothetical protein DS2_16099 [Catenovulum agarivorans DS-2]
MKGKLDAINAQTLRTTLLTTAKTPCYLLLNRKEVTGMVSAKLDTITAQSSSWLSPQQLTQH